MHRLLLYGSQALPDFRLHNLRQKLIAECGLPVSAVSATTVYLLDYQQDTTSADVSEWLPRLQELLAADTETALPTAQGWLSAPRPGTRSAWSSKATDIARRCGFAAVAGIEHAVLWLLYAQQQGEHASETLKTLPESARRLLHDPMLQQLSQGICAAAMAPADLPQRPLRYFELPHPASEPAAGQQSLEQLNHNLTLGLQAAELDWLRQGYASLGRGPTDAELLMFAQANSEHCRHKIFNAQWLQDGQILPQSLFQMIRHTHAQHSAGVLSAYHDNAAVVQGLAGMALEPDAGHEYRFQPTQPIPFQIKVETHNHPTAISPWPGAATGSGGEIRDEAATGRGAQPRGGLTGFSVSELLIPGQQQPWEHGLETPSRQATALQIMLEAPLGAAAFNNEFGRPALGGYWRTLTLPDATTEAAAESVSQQRWWGYHKPIMIAGGCGQMREGQVDKLPLRPGDVVIVLGGPAMLIGLGGGSASSQHGGSASEALDFSSVQRGNPEMQRRCQEVINRCWMQGEHNPIRSIHDVGAGGLSNAVPELLHDAGCGGELQLRDIPCTDPSMSPMEIWCNESQERYVIGMAGEDVPRFAELCQRERCPFAVIGVASDEDRLRLHDAWHDNDPVDMPMSLLLGDLPRMQREYLPALLTPAATGGDEPGCWHGIDLANAIERVLALPSVGSKQFLITIGDRHVGGLTCREQMVGPWQVPVADHALMLNDFHGSAGVAMSMGERSPVAIRNAPAAARLAIAEAVLNLAGAGIADLSTIKLSANWMAACGRDDQAAALYDSVAAVALEMCPALGLAIPVGKDSLSMQVQWQRDQNDGSAQQCEVAAPVSLIVSAFAAVADVELAVTPQLQQLADTRLWLIAPNGRQQRLGCSALAQVYARELDSSGQAVADVDDNNAFRKCFDLVQQALQADAVLACHDRSDGGLLCTALEMAFAGRAGITLHAPEEDLVGWLFNEEPGLLLQLHDAPAAQLNKRFADAGLGQCMQLVGTVEAHQDLRIVHASAADDDVIGPQPLWTLQQHWARTSHLMQRLRDNPACADEEFASIRQWRNLPLCSELTFTPPAAPMIHTGAKPRVAILREQGVNSQTELAAAFMHAGFTAVDVHMSDVHANPQLLQGFQGLAACGGFSYGDVLGAGRGWARSILFNAQLRRAFADFFADQQRFALGICNGCQMLASLRELIPGTGHWPDLVANRSGQYECRMSLVEVQPGPSLFFQGMQGSVMPIVSAHGEGRMRFADDQAQQAVAVSMRYVQAPGQVTELYPYNPNGSPQGICAVSNCDGRITISMPHPERLLRRQNAGWLSAAAMRRAPQSSPWLQMFHNARNWLR